MANVYPMNNNTLYPYVTYLLFNMPFMMSLDVMIMGKDKYYIGN